MHNFMDADESLCMSADISYDYEKYLEDNYKIIAERLNVSVEEVRRHRRRKLNMFNLGQSYQK